MKNKDLIELHSKLTRIETNNGDHKYIFAKNKRLIEAELKRLQLFLEPYENFIVFERERLAICKNYAQKDEKGNLKTINNTYIIEEEKQEDFDNAIAELKIKHKEALDMRDKQIKEYQDSLENEATLVLHLIKRDTIKDYTNAQIDLIFELIEAPKDETTK